MSSYQPLATTGNGSIYNSGVVLQQQQGIEQMALIRGATGSRGGKQTKRRKHSYKKKNYRGGAEVTPIPVAYSDGGGINNAYAELTAVNNQQQASAAYDHGVVKGGKRYKKSKRRSFKRGNKRRKTFKRSKKSRRHM